MEMKAAIGRPGRPMVNVPALNDIEKITWPGVFSGSINIRFMPGMFIHTNVLILPVEAAYSA
jgi:hypothetical protein